MKTGTPEIRPIYIRDFLLLDEFTSWRHDDRGAHNFIFEDNMQCTQLMSEYDFSSCKSPNTVYTARAENPCSANRPLSLMTVRPSDSYIDLREHGDLFYVVADTEWVLLEYRRNMSTTYSNTAHDSCY